MYYEIKKVDTKLGIMWKVSSDYDDVDKLFFSREDAKDYVEYLKTL